MSGIVTCDMRQGSDCPVIKIRHRVLSRFLQICLLVTGSHWFLLFKTDKIRRAINALSVASFSGQLQYN